MAITGYCTIDNKYYRLVVEPYNRQSMPLKTVRTGVLGNTIVSLQAGKAEETTVARLFVDYDPTGDWGSMPDIKAASEKATVSYTDHITGDATKIGSGTFNITITGLEYAHAHNSPMPSSGYHVDIEWVVVKTVS